jgi:hypothetical protein
MPRFFFNVSYDGEVGRDSEGVELADHEAAWSEAIGSCGQMISDLDGAMKDATAWRMEVTDHVGTPLFRVCFQAERVEGAAPPARKDSPLR